MNEQFCPHCGKTMVNPIGQMFYCPDECDLRVANAGSQEIPNEREFQIGDRVRVYKKIDTDSSYEIGNILYITRFYNLWNDSLCVECTSEDDGVYLHVYLEELELCPLETNTRKPREFKKGDRVKVIKKLDGDSYYDVGDEFYISSKAVGHHYGPTWRCTRNLNIDKWGVLIYTDELELVEAAP
ncbi:MAG TPA: hypothetical protein VMW10_03665 [Alphaproteobacteria bacterium]|nr:hypothetical protein [Alphaproteobacteria bacterium]